MARDAMGFGVKLEGAKELRRKLERLTAAQQRRVVRPAVTKALSPVVKQAKRNVPVVTGLLKKSIGKKVKAYTRSGVVWGGVGPRGGFEGVGPDGRKRNPVFYAHLVELGTMHTPAKSPFRKALKSRAKEAIGILRTSIWAGIAKLARRA